MKPRHHGAFAPLGLRLLASTCLAALATCSGQAWAQDATKDQSGAAGSGGLETIVVTARYTKENLQRTPIAITTTTSEQLKSANVTNINTLGTLVPNLFTHMGDADEGGVPVISMRGVQQNDASYARAPAVALYVDDVYHPTAAGAELDLTDIDRVEVDRGPQSTLSGNASIGGAIKLYTKDPTGDGSGYASMTYGSFNELLATAAYDMTIAPNLYARVSGHWKKQDGYVTLLDFTCEMNKLGTPALAGSFPTAAPDASAHNCKTGEEGDANQSGARIKLRWVPNDRLSVKLQSDIQLQDDSASPEVTIAYTDPYPNPSSLIDGYNTQIENQFGIRLDNRFLPPMKYASYASFCRPLLNPPLAGVPSGICYPNAKKQDSQTSSATIDYQLLDNVHLTAIGAYNRYGNDYIQNGDQSPLGFILSHFSQRTHSVTGEVRLNGSLFANRLDWVVGSFMESVSGQSNGFIGYLLLNFNEFDKALIQSDSGFFHVDYKLTDRWRFSTGARWTWGKTKYTFNHPGLLVVNQPFAAYEHRWDWLASTDYQITDDIMAYATVATGSRPPGVTTIIITQQQLSATPAEALTSYEAGIKTEFFNHRLRFNIDGFYADYSKRLTAVQGVQCLGELPGATWHPNPSDCATLFPSNPGNLPWTITSARPATVTGVEWELTAAPIDNLKVNFSGGYNHFESSVKDPTQPGYVNPASHVQPEWNMHADAEYNLETSIGTFTPRIDWAWQSQQDSEFSAARAPRPEFTIKAYSLFNAQIGYVPPESKWSAVFAVTNLTDEYNYYQPFGGPEISVDVSSNVGPPREFSITLKREF